mgnify:CR=1 FL=1
MAKVQKITGSQTWQKQHQVAMFRARTQHATGTYHILTRYGSVLLNAHDKSPLLTICQKGSEDTMANM